MIHWNLGKQFRGCKKAKGLVPSLMCQENQGGQRGRSGRKVEKEGVRKGPCLAWSAKLRVYSEREENPVNSWEPTKYMMGLVF